MEINISAEIDGSGQAQANGNGESIGRTLTTHYRVEAFRNGVLLWVDEFDNLVVTAGLNDALDKHLKGSSYTAAWYVGITAGSPSFAAADTMSSHGGWTEITAYDEANRPTLTLGTVSAGSVDNSASKATYTVSSNGTTIGGMFVVANSTKGGTTGTLYGGGAFSAGNKTLDDNDVLNVTVTLTTTAS